MGAGAIAAGSTLAVVLQKLFFLAIGRALGLKEPLAFHISFCATGFTVLIFAGVFGVVSLYTIWMVKRTSLADLIRAASRPKAPPAFAWWKVAICVAGLATTYGLALAATARSIVAAVLKELGLTVTGEAHLPVLEGSLRTEGMTYQPGGPEAPSGEPLQFDGRISLKAFHDHRMTHQLMVVSDETFAALQAMPGAGATVNVHGYKLARWQDSLEAAQQLNREIKDGGHLRATALIYAFQREDSILMLFLAAFLGLLFFLAAGVREVRQVVTAHTLVLFAAPMGVALLHTAVAMSVFRVVLGVPSLWRHGRYCPQPRAAARWRRPPNPR